MENFLSVSYTHLEHFSALVQNFLHLTQFKTAPLFPILMIYVSHTHVSLTIQNIFYGQTFFHLSPFPFKIFSLLLLLKVPQIINNFRHSLMQIAFHAKEILPPHLSLKIPLNIICQEY